MGYILITGLMGSGKSSLIRAYLRNFKTLEFIPPPVEAIHEGLQFEFIDNVFATMHSYSDKVLMYNFYELDAPTINKWRQFVSIANGIIIVVNDQPIHNYHSPEYLMNILIEVLPSDSPVLFVVNNYKSFEDAKNKLIDEYKLTKIPFKYEILPLSSGEKVYTPPMEPFLDLDVNEVKNIFTWIIENTRDKLVE